MESCSIKLFCCLGALMTATLLRYWLWWRVNLSASLLFNIFTAWWPYCVSRFVIDSGTFQLQVTGIELQVQVTFSCRWLALGITPERPHTVFNLWWLLGDVWDITPTLSSCILKPDLAVDSNLYLHAHQFWESDVETELPFALGGGDSKAWMTCSVWSSQPALCLPGEQRAAVTRVVC